MQSLLTPDALHLLREIGRTGTLAAAARAVGVDHSSAYRRLGAIERRLGVRLFERARDGYAPTAAGELAIATAGRVLEDLATLDRQLAGRDLLPRGQVRVTLPDTLLDVVVPLVAKFARAYPEIAIELATANAFFTLAKRDADVALRAAAAPPDGLVARRICGIATALYASSAADPASSPFVAPDDTLAHLASARWIATHVAPERIVLRANSLNALRLAAGAGLGISALPCFVGDRDAGLVRCTKPIEEMASSLWLLTHPDLRRTARVRAFVDFAAAELAAHKAAFEGSAA